MRCFVQVRAMTVDLRQTYDAFPYKSYPFPQTHPDRLATIGSLFGLAPTPVDRCRVLGLGCSSGGNLIPMAASLPASEFIGVDFSPVQIREGVAEVEALGLANIRLECMDIMDVGDRFGRFDYIIAHGVYSWVPKDVQEAILALCARQLAPHGIAYISYNTLPGWGMRGVVRSAMRYHTRQFTDPVTKVQQGRAILEFLAKALGEDPSAYGVMLRAEAEAVRGRPDYYVLHDYLEGVNEPLHFHEFMERAARHALRYLGEAAFQDMFTGDLGAEMTQTLARVAPDLLRREQMMDFLRNRTFRQTLLVHEAASLERKVSPLRVTSLYAASQARPVRGAIDVRASVAEEFRTPDGSGLTTPYPISKAALVLLAELWPASLPFATLCARAADAAGVEVTPTTEGVLAALLLSGYAGGAVELHTIPSAFVRECGARPAAGAVQRRLAARGEDVTTLRHERIRIDEATRILLPLLDGARTRAGIAALAWPSLPAEQAQRLLEEALPQLAAQALLVG